MQTNGSYTEKLNTYVRYTIECGVKPFEVFLQPISDCYGGEAIAYRALIRVNSVISGALDPNDYLFSISDEEVAVQLGRRIVKKAIAALRVLEEGNVPCKMLFVRCPQALLFCPDLYVRLKALLAESDATAANNNAANGNNGGNGNKYVNAIGKKLCLEFDGGITSETGSRLSEGFAAIRAAGCKTAIYGYGGEAFSIESLLTSCPDYLFLDERVASFAVDREKRATVAPLVNLAKSLGGEVIASGVASDDELREFRSRDCFAFIPDANYKGTSDAPRAIKTAEQIVFEGGSHER